MWFFVYALWVCSNYWNLSDHWCVFYFPDNTPPKKALKWQFLKLRNLHCYNWDPACTQCGTHLHGGRRCSVLPWVHRGCCVQQQLHISCWGGWSHGGWKWTGMVWPGELQLLSWACFPVTVGHERGGKPRGAAQPFPRSASVAVPFPDTHGHPSTCQAVPSSVLLQGHHSLACWDSWGLLHFQIFHRLTWLSVAWSKGLEQLVLLRIILWSKPWMLPAFVLVETQSKAHWNQILFFYWLY